jgi:hypothetical protein
MLALSAPPDNLRVMYNHPYLETCCRAALHRLYLAGQAGRLADRMDAPCLQRLAEMGLSVRNGSRFTLTPSGTQRHATEVLKQAPVRPTAR